MTRLLRHLALGSRASRKPVMIAAASTRIRPSFFVAPGECSTGLHIANQVEMESFGEVCSSQLWYLPLAYAVRVTDDVAQSRNPTP